MTSGNFHPVEITKVVVNRDERQRYELSGIDVLADSIRRLGLIHPIVISRTNHLVAGERRLEACRQLGWTHIPAQFTDEIEPHILRSIELEENVKRKDLTWQDQCRAITDYHNLRCETEPEWSQEKTAEALGLEQTSISKHLSVAKAIASGDTALQEIQKFSTAVGKVARDEARKDEESLQELRKALNIPAALIAARSRPSVVAADFTEWVKTYDGPRFNFIHCDFPYGINADKMQQGGSVATHGGYSDTADTYFHLLNTLCNNLDRLCTESAHIMFWFSMHHYSDTLDFIHSHSDFIIDPFPLVWLKSDNIGLLPDPQRGPRRIYETALFGSRGDRKIVSSVSNAYAAPTDRSQHMSTKPEPVLRHFFRMFVDSTTLLLDPTCGSGTSLRSAESLGARHTLGVELNPEFAKRAELALEASRRLRRATTKEVGNATRTLQETQAQDAPTVTQQTSGDTR